MDCSADIASWAEMPLWIAWAVIPVATHDVSPVSARLLFGSCTVCASTLCSSRTSYTPSYRRRLSSSDMASSSSTFGQHGVDTISPPGSDPPPASGVSPFDLPLSRLSVAGKSAHSQRPVNVFASHDHIVRSILSYVERPTLSSCLQVSRQFHDIASETIYRSVRLFENDAGDGRPLDKVLLGWDNGVFMQLLASESGAPKSPTQRPSSPTSKLARSATSNT